MNNLIRKIINASGYVCSKTHLASDIEDYIDIYGPESVHHKKFYNIGGGDFSHPMWTNIDNYNSGRYNTDRKKTINRINYDLFSKESLPIDANFAEIVYSSHTVEHITDEAAQNIFDESFRILKKGGHFRVVTPNIDLFFEAYKKIDRYFFCWIDEYSKPEVINDKKINLPMNQATIGELFLYYFASSVSTLHADGAAERINDNELKKIFSEMEYESALNYCKTKCPIELQKRYPMNHINWWNKDKMFMMLKRAGFENVYLSGHGQSLSPVLRNLSYFDPRPKMSLYVEAKK